MRHLIIYILLFFGFFETKFETGIYSHETRYFSENINLMNDNTFKYTYDSEFLYIKVDGFWIQNGDRLVLNSSPQHDKIIVFEQRSKKKKNKDKFIFWIKTKEELLMNYSISLFNDEGKEIKLIEQWEKTEFDISDFKISSFEVTDTKGLKTPRYFIKGKFTNCFNVYIDERRIFDGEIWDITDNGLVPKLMNGVKANYILSKIGRVAPTSGQNEKQQK